MGAFEHGCSTLEHAHLCVFAEVIACHAFAKQAFQKENAKTTLFQSGFPTYPETHSPKPTEGCTGFRVQGKLSNIPVSPCILIVVPVVSCQVLIAR